MHKYIIRYFLSLLSFLTIASANCLPHSQKNAQADKQLSYNKELTKLKLISWAYYNVSVHLDKDEQDKLLAQSRFLLPNGYAYEKLLSYKNSISLKDSERFVPLANLIKKSFRISAILAGNEDQLFYEKYHKTVSPAFTPESWSILELVRAIKNNNSYLSENIKELAPLYYWMFFNILPKDLSDSHRNSLNFMFEFTSALLYDNPHYYLNFTQEICAENKAFLGLPIPAEQVTDCQEFHYAVQAYWEMIRKFVPSAVAGLVR